MQANRLSKRLYLISKQDECAQNKLYKAKELSDNEREQKFFYAEDYAKYYDQTIELVVPYYARMYEVLTELLNFQFKQNADQGEHGYLLDVGCGTGQKTISILEAFPGVSMVGLDLCQSMLNIFADKVKDKEELCARIQMFRGNIFGDACTTQKLIETISDKGRKQYRAIISALTFHHFTVEEKRETYRRIFEILEPDGVFINADLFGYQSTEFTEWNRENHIKRFKHNFDSYDFSGSQDKRLTQDLCINLAVYWENHYRKDNLLLPVEYEVDPIGKRHGCVTEFELLREAGFKQLRVPYRYWLTGIVLARKSID